MEQLNSLSAVELRQMAEEAGLTTRKKPEIVIQLADDAPRSTGHSVLRKSASLIESAIDEALRANQPDKDSIRELVQEVIGEVKFSAPVSVDSQNGTGQLPSSPLSTETVISWSEVPEASCDVNGEYVTPPWWDELVTASQVSHIELKGSAGSGKTLAVHKLAEQLGKKLAVVTADGGLRKRDLIGQREIANGTTYFDAGEFATSAKNGDWALLDEANFADADALGFLNGMTDRAGTEGSTFNIGGKVIPVHPDFRCFITRNQGYAGTKNMNEALRDRFWTIEVPPLMDEDLVLMLRSHGMLKVFAQDASFQVTALYKTWENNQINYQVSPRRALVAWQLAEQLGSERKDFRELLTKSILTKIDAKHDKEAIAFQIKTNWSTLDSMEKRGQKNNG
tara:strand:+ start:3276 stop:4460 length:1185 start_codon:yes stop_codon:yes gene_type:complete